MIECPECKRHLYIELIEGYVSTCPFCDATLQIESISKGEIVNKAAKTVIISAVIVGTVWMIYVTFGAHSPKHKYSNAYGNASVTSTITFE